jgi:hypothetical protein
MNSALKSDYKGDLSCKQIFIARIDPEVDDKRRSLV